MRILLDTCVWGGAVDDLEAAGHDVRWVGAWPQDPGDPEILQRALTDERVLVTLDKDFGELAILHQQPHSGIIRLVNWSIHQQAAACNRAIARYGEELMAGALVTAEPGRLRIRY